MKQFVSHCVLITTFFLSTFPITANAEIYSYVDENGKTQYTNITPPQTAKSVKADKEITVNRATVQERLELKQSATEESYKWKKEEQREAAQIAKEKRTRENRINIQIREKKRELKKKIRKEKKYILTKEKNWLLKCDGMKTGFLIVQKCRDLVKKRTKEDLRLLRKSTRSYFIHKYSNRSDTDSYLGKMYDSLLENY